jgi:hypothetical protein
MDYRVTSNEPEDDDSDENAEIPTEIITPPPPKKNKPNTGVSPTSTTKHVEIALRFTHFVEMLDKLRKKWVIPSRREAHASAKFDPPERVPSEDYLITVLKRWLQDRVRLTPSPETTMTRTKQPHSAIKNDRTAFPVYMIKAAVSLLEGEELNWSLEGSEKKIEPTWVVAYLNGILPDKTKDGWQSFELSHRCVEYHFTATAKGKNERCVTANCLVWESKAVNQYRGHSKDHCCKKCSHDGCKETVCVCQRLHDPHCL